MKNMKNSFLDLCRMRRSVRAYAATLPSQEDVDYIMECVRMAPSAVNFQPWHFRYVTDKEQMGLLAACYPREWFLTAPACFVVYRDKEAEWVRKADGKPHGDIDVAIAVEHLCLAAAERGLGTCWVCNFDVARCHELFTVPEHWEAVALVPIGTPTDEATEKKRKPLADILFYDK